MANKHMKRCSIPLVFREIQMKNTMRYHSSLIRMSELEKTDHTSYWLGCRADIGFWWACEMGQPL